MIHRPPAASMSHAHLPPLRVALRWPLVLLAVFLALLTCGEAVAAAPAAPGPAAPKAPDLEYLEISVHEALSGAVGVIESLIPLVPADGEEGGALQAAWELIAEADHRARLLLRSARAAKSAPATAVDRALHLVDRKTRRAEGLLRSWEKGATTPEGAAASAMEGVREKCGRALSILREARLSYRARGLRPAVPVVPASRSREPEGEDKVRMAGSGCPRASRRPR